MFVRVSECSVFFLFSTHHERLSRFCNGFQIVCALVTCDSCAGDGIFDGDAWWFDLKSFVFILLKMSKTLKLGK